MLNFIQKFLCFIVLLIMGFQNVFAQEIIFNETPQSVRVRLFKNLNSFPEIAGAQIKQLSERLWVVKGMKLFFKNKKLSTENFIIRTNDQKYDLISQLNFNYYLAGVVASEMPVRWPLEALKAQAVVARSYALAQIQQRKNKNFHLDSDQMDQVYNAVESKRALIAVLSTNNIVLRKPDGSVLKAFFHSDCGGQTIPASKVWPTEFDSGTAIDPWCKARAANHWSYSIPQKTFFENLKQNEVDSYFDITAIFSQKIQEIQINNSPFSIQKLRQIFGFSKIRNSPDEIKSEKGFVKFNGQGYGHGVGLCQWGSYEQAKRGFTSLQILKHYYPRAQILQSAVRLASVSH